MFGGGTIYSWIQTYLTYQLLRCALNTRRLCWCRLFLSLLCTLFIVGFIVLYYFAAKNKKKHPGRKHSFIDWQPTDAGYSLHVASSTCEWLLMISLFSYFGSFTKEFNKVKVNLHVQRHRNVLAPFQSSMSEDDGEYMEHA